jgi:uncharacterized membrane protein (UPF0127 family)
MRSRASPAAEPLRDGALLKVTNSTRGAVLAERAEVASVPWRRMRGLLGRPALEPGHGLLLAPCQGVHSLGMAYPIDVIHLDRHNVVRVVLHQLAPWRIGPLVWRGRVALELPAGAAANTSVGDELTLEPLR